MSKRRNAIINRRDGLSCHLTEAVPIYPFWCFFSCLLPTPDGYNNKVKVRCQSKFASDMQGKSDSIGERRDFEYHNFLSALFHVFKVSRAHTWNTQSAVNSTRSQGGTEMEFIKSNYFAKWIRWETGEIVQTFPRLGCLPEIWWHVTYMNLRNIRRQTE